MNLQNFSLTSSEVINYKMKIESSEISSFISDTLVSVSITEGHTALIQLF